MKGGGAMDSLKDWYRYVDEVSRRSRTEEDDRPSEGRRGRRRQPDAEPYEPAQPLRPHDVPDLGPLLTLRGVADSRQTASLPYEDLTVHDQLQPMSSFSVPELEAPRFTLEAPRLTPLSPGAPRPKLEAPPAEAPRAEPAPEPPKRSIWSSRPAAPESEPPAAVREAPLPPPRKAPTPSSPLQVAAPAEAPQVAEAEPGGERNWEMLSRMRSREVAQNSYKSPFRETREELIQRLLDPPLTLEEAARLLGVCPTTVRRYTNKGVLRHFRTSGNQRRFRLSDVLDFMDSRGAELEADAKVDQEAGAAQ
jgi:excisionase family DNA binding protein